MAYNEICSLVRREAWAWNRIAQRPRNNRPLCCLFSLIIKMQRDVRDMTVVVDKKTREGSRSILHFTSQQRCNTGIALPFPCRHTTLIPPLPQPPLTNLLLGARSVAERALVLVEAVQLHRLLGQNLAVVLQQATGHQHDTKQST